MFQQQAVFTNMFPSICLSEGAKHIIHTLQVFLFDFALHFSAYLLGCDYVMYLSPSPPNPGRGGGVYEVYRFMGTSCFIDKKAK